MPRYLNVNSTFEPFSFQEKIAPLLMYKEEYDKTEEKYINEMTDLSEIGSILPEGSGLSSEYKNLENKIIASRDKLYNEGYSLGLKRELNALKGEVAKFKDRATHQYNKYLEDQKYIRSVEDKLGRENIKWNTENITLDSYAPTLNDEGKFVTPTIDLGYTNYNSIEKEAAALASAESAKYSNRIIQTDNTSTPGIIKESYYNGLNSGEIDITSPELNDNLKPLVEKYKNDSRALERIQQGYILGNKFETNTRQYTNPGYTTESWENYINTKAIQLKAEALEVENKVDEQELIKKLIGEGKLPKSEEPKPNLYPTASIYTQYSDLGISNPTKVDEDTFNQVKIISDFEQLANLSPSDFIKEKTIKKLLKKQGETPTDYEEWVKSNIINRVKELASERHIELYKEGQLDREALQIFNKLYDIEIHFNEDKETFVVGVVKKPTGKINEKDIIVTTLNNDDR